MRRIGLAGLLAMLLSMAGLTLAAPGAMAFSTIGDFELDGNLLDNSGLTTEPIDWATPPPNLSKFTDPFDRQPDTVFDTGSKDNDPAGWDCSNAGSAPGKDDIKRGEIAFRRVNGDLWAYVHFFRFAVNGDAHADFEFHQSTEPASALCPDVPKRTAQDQRISFDTKNGGATINVCPQTWTGTAFVPDHHMCAVDRSLADGAVNIPPFLTIPGEKNGAFGEAAVNLTKTIGEFSCGEFAGAYMKTRAATSADAALKDFTRSQPIATGECPLSTTTKAVRNATTNSGGMFSSAVDAKPGDLIDYQVKYSNAGPGIAHNVVVKDTIADGQTYVANSCGTCTVSVVDGKTVLTWNLGDVGVTTLTLSFQVQITGTFGLGTATAIKNVAVTTTTEEGPKNSTETTVNVKTPSSSLEKLVRNFTTNSTGAFTESIAGAKPGQIVQYQLKYTNAGPGTATNVVVTDTVNSKSTYVASSCTLDAPAPTPPCTVSGSTITWTIGTVPAGTSRFMTFKVELTGPFTTATTQIPNTGVLDTAEEPPENSNPTTVTVDAPPSSSLEKLVRNFTTNSTGSFTESIAGAKPGQIVQYQLKYTNAGPGTATNVVVTDTVNSKSTYVASSCTLDAPAPTPPCTVSGSTITWTIGTVPAGTSRFMTFKVELTGPFTTATTQVPNTGVLDTAEEPPENSNPTTVTVDALPNLTIAKTANKSAVVSNDQITYTLTYANTGTGTASVATVSDVIPAGTSYVSCTGGCSEVNGTVTWSVGPVAPNGGGSVTLTVRVNAVVTTCSICNVAKIASPDQNNGTAISSTPACVSASPSADPSTAKASGNAVGLKAYVPLIGIPLLNANISEASSSQTGPGQSADSDKFLSLDILGVVGLASVAKADVLTTSSSSQVSSTTGARQTSVSEVLGLNVLSGVVTADVVRSVATTRASGTASSYSAAGTTATNLRVLGNSVANASPGLKIPLDGNIVDRLLYGKGSYVAINDQTGSTSGPASGQNSGGIYKADLTTTMIRVYITGGTVGTLLTLGGAPVEITVAKATAHSEHKQTPLCTTGSPTQAVSGHAFIASAQADPLLSPSTVGFVEIPASGGTANKSVTAALLPSDGSVVSTTDAAANTTGTNGPTSSTASSYAQTAGACVLRVISAGCVVKATLIRSQANSTASSGARSSNATGTQFVDLVVAGVPIAGTPPPNTVIRLPLALGYVVLNEQVPDGPETGHTGLTVRAVHAVITTPFDLLGVGAEVIVAEAHSDATFR